MVSPPNLSVAVGPDHVGRSADHEFRITDRAGASLKTVAFTDLFQLPGGTEALEGQIYYNAVHGRWIAIEVSRDCTPGGGALHGHGYLDFAVSDTANPKLGWTAYYYTYNDALVWRPRLGTSADKVVLTTYNHPMNAFCASNGQDTWDATAITWAGLLSGAFSEAYFPFEPSAEDVLEFLTPTVRDDTGSNTLDLLAQFYEFGPAARQSWLVRITGAGSTAQASLVRIGPDVVPTYGLNAFVAQSGGNSQLGYGPISAVSHGHRVVTANAELCTPTGDTQERACVRIVDLDTSTSTPSRRQDFFLAVANKDTWDTGLAFAQNGDLIASYHRSSSTLGPATSVVRQGPGDALGSMSPPTVFQTPTGSYLGASGADMIVASQDPQAPDAVWLISQTGYGFAEYRVQVAQARSVTGDTYVPIAPLRILDTRTATGLSGGFVANIPRTFNVAGAGTIPANAVAITGNVTVAGQSGAGYLSVGPTATVNPTSSTINFPVGDNRANNLTLPLNAAGDLAAVYKAGAGKTTHVIVDVTGYFLADDTGVKYHTLTPARVLDSRVGAGLAGKFVANTPRTFQVSGHAGVPAGAVAITGNLTVVGQTKAGYVSLTPAPDPNPLTSTINFPLGDTRANGVTVPLSGAGKLSAVFKASGGSTDLILDVTGYYLAGASGLRFYPLNPGRIMDTRFNTLTQLFGPFTSSIPRTLVTGGHFGVPADGVAVTGNLTVVGQTKAGYVSITKLPDSTPPVSTLNFPLGDVRANGVTVPLNGANDMAIVYKATSGAKTHLILDLTGYFR
jgi:hypothetical protein